MSKSTNKKQKVDLNAVAGGFKELPKIEVHGITDYHPTNPAEETCNGTDCGRYYNREQLFSL